MKPSETSHRINWEKETANGEVLFYQIEGDSTVNEGGTEHHLGRNYMFRAKKGRSCVSQHAPRSICVVIRMQVEHNEDTLGALATRRATDKAQEWLKATFAAISKAVLNQADHGLFRAVVRFEDNAMHDQVNQRSLLKLLRSQDIQGTFKQMDDTTTELHLVWGARV